MLLVATEGDFEAELCNKRSFAEKERGRSLCSVRHFLRVGVMLMLVEVQKVQESKSSGGGSYPSNVDDLLFIYTIPYTHR